MWAAVTPNQRSDLRPFDDPSRENTLEARGGGTITMSELTDSTNLLCCGLPLPVTMTTAHGTPGAREKAINFLKVIASIVFDKVPRQLYLNALLHLPALYYSRVSRILDDAESAVSEVRKLYTPGPKHTIMREFVEEEKRKEEEERSQREVAHFKSTWELFVDSIMREWKTLNIVSVLLLSYVKIYL
jgi:hypothetical protein